MVTQLRANISVNQQLLQASKTECDGKYASKGLSAVDAFR